MAYVDRATNNEDMVAKLKISRSLNNAVLEKAFLKIPRGLFVTDEIRDRAYFDSPQRMPSLGFNISAPHIYCACLEALELKEGMKVLDVGCGTAHLTALCAWVVGPKGHVHGIDIREEVMNFAQHNLYRLKNSSGIYLNNISLELRNCFLPDPFERTFDRIHCGASCPKDRIPYFYSALNPGGIMVVPSGTELLRISKDEATDEISMKTISRVIYGDLILPGEDEVRTAIQAIEEKKRQKISIPDTTLRSDLGSLLNCPDFSDVTFKLSGNSKIHAHRAILSQRSEFFRSMFKSGLLESSQREIWVHWLCDSFMGSAEQQEQPHHPLPNLHQKEHEYMMTPCEEEIFSDIMKFIYTDEVRITPENAVDLLAASNFYKLDRLKSLCELRIKEMMDMENCVSILEVADKYNAQQLKRVVTDFVVRNYEDLRSKDSFCMLDKTLLIDITGEACKRLYLQQQLQQQQQAIASSSITTATTVGTTATAELEANRRAIASYWFVHFGHPDGSDEDSADDENNSDDEAIALQNNNNNNSITSSTSTNNNDSFFTNTPTSTNLLVIREQHLQPTTSSITTTASTSNNTSDSTPSSSSDVKHARTGAPE